jgi:threonine aldolase
MGNLVALLAQGERGGEILLEEKSHILRSELGGVAGIAGLFPRPIPGVRGAMDLDALREALNPQFLPNRTRTTLVVMETSHNYAGGAVLPLAHMAAVYALAKDRGIPVHTDGARLFNAAAALGVGADRIAAHTDTVTFCISKGLSAPIGAVLVGSRDFITRARAFRRMVGGNLRQAGGIAAAGIIALERMVDRLAEDHVMARRLAEGLHRIDPSLVDPAGIDTNIVFVDLAASGRDAVAWVEGLQQRGILAGASGATGLRLLTHRHIGAADIDATLRAFAEIRGTAA